MLLEQRQQAEGQKGTDDVGQAAGGRDGRKAAGSRQDAAGTDDAVLSRSVRRYPTPHCPLPPAFRPSSSPAAILPFCLLPVVCCLLPYFAYLFAIYSLNLIITVYRT